MWGEVFHRPDPPVFTDQQFQTHFTCCGPLVITWRVTSAAYVFLCMNRRVCSAFVGLKQYSVRSQHSVGLVAAQGDWVFVLFSWLCLCSEEHTRAACFMVEQMISHRRPVKSGLRERKGNQAEFFYFFWWLLVTFRLQLDRHTICTSSTLQWACHTICIPRLFSHMKSMSHYDTGWFKYVHRDNDQKEPECNGLMSILVLEWSSYWIWSSLVIRFLF